MAFGQQGFSSVPPGMLFSRQKLQPLTGGPGDVFGQQAATDAATRTNDMIPSLVALAGQGGGRQSSAIPLSALRNAQQYFAGGGEIPGAGPGTSLAGPLAGVLAAANARDQGEGASTSSIGLKDIMTPAMTSAAGGLLGKFLENDPAARTEYNNWINGGGRETVTAALGGASGFDNWSKGGSNPADLLSALANYYG